MTHPRTRLSPPPRPLDLIRWPEAALWCIVGLAAGWVLAWEIMR